MSVSLMNNGGPCRTISDFWKNVIVAMRISSVSRPSLLKLMCVHVGALLLCPAFSWNNLESVVNFRSLVTWMNITETLFGYKSRIYDGHFFAFSNYFLF